MKSFFDKKLCQYNNASTGNTSASHLAMAYFDRMANVVKSSGAKAE
jgi:hypothetical protein